MLAHNVYFALKDNSEAAIQKLVAACKKFLATHPGIVFFACGTLQKDLARPFNDRGFDVALHVVFDSKASHDAYQLAPLHQTFVEENQENWANVRVFDSEVASA
ncbi:MAG: Dabb family protein [Singulisphaera sp.]|nr:Dabb family protein [Singulisphaera sp.]